VAHYIWVPQRRRSWVCTGLADRDEHGGSRLGDIRTVIAALANAFAATLGDERATRVALIEAWGSEALMRRRVATHAILRHTTTLGVRVRRVEHRWALERRFATVSVAGHDIAVKLGLLDGEIVNAKPEHRDCVRVAEATGRSVKSVWTQALSAAHSQLMSDAVAESR
jgi:hypothetical protein